MRAQLRTSLIILALCSIGARRLHAETKTAPAAVAGVVAIGGNAEARDRAAVLVGVVEATRAAGWELPARSLTRKETAGLLKCLEPGELQSCIPQGLAGRGAFHALLVAADQQQAEDGSPMIVLTAKLLVTEPPALLVRQRFCEHCTDDGVTAAATELARQLLEELAVRVGRTLLVVRSTPPGARIVLDGKPIGATDGTFNTYPGKHLVVLEKAGFATQTIAVDAAEGKTAEVSMVLPANATNATTAVIAKPPAMTSPSSRVIPGALIGGGSALLVASAVLLYFGQQDGSDDKYRYPHATGVGVGAGVAGAAAVGAGIYLWLRASGASGPVASAIPGGLAVGWTRTF